MCRGELILPKSIPPEIEKVEIFFLTGRKIFSFLESLALRYLLSSTSGRLFKPILMLSILSSISFPVAVMYSLMEEIDLFLADDGSIPPGIESDDVDSVDDDTSISLPEFESFYVDYPNSGNSTIDVVDHIPSQEINNLSVPALISQAPGPSRKRIRSPSSPLFPDAIIFSDGKPASETSELNPEDVTARLEDLEVEINTLHADTEDKKLLISELQDSLAAAENEIIILQIRVANAEDRRAEDHDQIQKILARLSL
ncbi:hypothetical protein Tco_0705287 [Tanacetum coccineum]|uniref:Uncharacterized protein n=1 Tax=Tanacetum coccineum TaxID=301880 RepID=A0ABQ4Y4B4_9ASTR